MTGSLFKHQSQLRIPPPALATNLTASGLDSGRPARIYAAGASAPRKKNAQHGREHGGKYHPWVLLGNNCCLYSPPTFHPVAVAHRADRSPPVSPRAVVPMIIFLM